MSKFNLEKALAGEKVVTRDGREVTQLVMFKADSKCVLYGLDVDNDTIESWFTSGTYHDGLISGADLLMAPKKLSGFVNVYTDGDTTIHKKYNEAIEHANRIQCELLACIDISSHDEGEGLG
jgi:hypothetical protein